jgi:hypothetical protein
MRKLSTPARAHIPSDGFRSQWNETDLSVQALRVTAKALRTLRLRRCVATRAAPAAKAPNSAASWKAAGRVDLVAWIRSQPRGYACSAVTRRKTAGRELALTWCSLFQFIVDSEPFRLENLLGGYRHFSAQITAFSPVVGTAHFREQEQEGFRIFSLGIEHQERRDAECPLPNS